MKVLIIGLRAQHNDRLKAQFKGIDFECLDDKSKHEHDIKKCKGDYDHIFSVVKFTNRAVQKKFGSRKEFNLVTGGYSTVKKMLENFEKDLQNMLTS